MFRDPFVLRFAVIVTVPGHGLGVKVRVASLDSCLELATHMRGRIAREVMVKRRG